MHALVLAPPLIYDDLDYLSGAELERDWEGGCDPCPFRKESYMCLVSDSFLPSFAKATYSTSLEMIKIALTVP